MTFQISDVLIPQGEQYAAVSLNIADGQIQAIAPSESSQSATESLLDRYRTLLLPGFVNGHTHSSQMWQRGLIPQLPLELWLTDVIDSMPTSLEQFYLAALSVSVETLLSGGTCVVDHAYLLPNQEVESIGALVRGYTEAGIRAVICPLIQDLPLPLGLPGGMSLPYEPFPRSTQEVLEIMTEVVRQFHQPEKGIYIGVGPTGFQRCSDALLEGCRELSDRHNLCRHTHLLETRAQKLLAQERYGVTAVQHLQELGFLDHRTSLAHSVWITDADIEILAQTGSTVVHNPVSNLRLGSGIAPILKCLRAGVNVAFGCDGAASNDAQHLLEAIKLSTILHTITETDYRQWLPAHKALEMAAIGGAKGINLGDRTGSITVGKAADLVLYNLEHPSLLPLTDPMRLLVLGRPTDVIDSVWVNGKPVVENGQILTVDISSLRQEFRDRSQEIRQARFQTIHQIEAHYQKISRQF